MLSREIDREQRGLSNLVFLLDVSGSMSPANKLPLSTTYVTFMVAMGTSLSDQAWGRDSAVYRVSGVLTVIGGWFFTAMMAFTVSSIFATAIFFAGGWAVGAILVLAAVLVGARVLVRWEDPLFEDKNDVEGMQGRAATSLEWTARGVAGRFEAFTQGLYGSGWERSYPDAAQVAASAEGIVGDLGGKVDFLVNNAGGPPPGDFRDWRQTDWFDAVNGNMYSAIDMIRRCLDGMIERRFGRIVNITSVAVKMPVPNLGLSNGARTGLTGFVAGIAREPARHNVTINNIVTLSSLTISGATSSWSS